MWNLRGAVAVGDGSVVMWFVGLAPFVVLLGPAFCSGSHRAGHAGTADGHADLAAGMLVALWNHMGWKASTDRRRVEQPEQDYPKGW